MPSSHNLEVSHYNETLILTTSPSTGDAKRNLALFLLLDGLLDWIDNSGIVKLNNKVVLIV